ncbi:MAG: endonuclease MutS2 [Clostridia bacterium]|nr:endonuclease MutS2 [Clostridia bacterium]
MSNFTKALKTLEYNKILSLLAECASTDGGRELILTTVPEADISRVKKLLTQTTDAKNMTSVNGAPSFGGIRDVCDSVDRAEKGASLTLRELLDVADLLYVSAGLIAYSGSKNVSCGTLGEIFDRIFKNPTLEKEIKRVIITEDTISDDATPQLAAIRKNIRNTNNRIRDMLQNYITSPQYSKTLQDNIVTMRNGRYVIPVKVEHKSEISGLVHDASSSGATLFIEPVAVVDANNELRRLEAEERAEIERILANLSAEVAGFASALVLNYSNIILLDSIFARAELSWRMKAVEPIISDFINIIGARHPLLDKHKAVPIDVSLGENFDTLVITGPNTGGKTVSLKTLGLFTLMAQSGMHIPAREGSQIRVFDKVLADIGDEQSIEQSLSTFSAHMKTIVSILDEADNESLVLFDELGAGTDPTEGAALAVAITEQVRQSGAWSASTTHYSEMKVYALETPGVCNAACEFDIKTLSPTFKLIIGAPGKSNAFAIASRLGLKESVIERAGSLIAEDSKRFENVIEKLESDRIESQQKVEEAERMRLEHESILREAKSKAAADLAAAEREKERVLAKAAEIIENARATSEYVMAELEKAKRARDSERAASELEKARANIRASLKSSKNKVDPVIEHKVENYVLPRKLKKGDTVILIDINQVGTLVSEPDKDGNASVRAGIMTLKTSVKNLMLSEDAEGIIFMDEKKKRIPKAVVTESITKSFSPEIDLRGMNGEEARIELDKYFDNATVAGISTVRVIHGKGTGALKKYLWNFFKSDKRIKTFRLGNWGEGDTGVTIVELR